MNIEDIFGPTERLLDALSVLALHDLCAYVNIDGDPEMCDWEAYWKTREQEFNKYWLTKEQFNIICEYIKGKYKGKL